MSQQRVEMVARAIAPDKFQYVGNDGAEAARDEVRLAARRVLDVLDEAGLLAVTPTREQVQAVAGLAKLPPGSVLRHPQGDALVEVVERPLSPGEVHVRINGHGVNLASLVTDWDFPMALLYHPATAQ